MTLISVNVSQLSKVQNSVESKLMASTMTHHKLREIVSNRRTLCVGPNTAVLDVVREMQTHRLGAVLVVESGKLSGIFTGTNFVKQVLDAGKDPAKTRIGDVMTPQPKWLDCDCDGFEAVRLMEEDHLRHLVVRLADGSGFGVVSIADFPDSEIEEYEDEIAFEQRLWEEM